MKLYELSARYNELLELVNREAEENEGVIPDALATLLDKVEGDIEDKIKNCARQYKNLKAWEMAVKEERAALKKKEDRLKAQAEWLLKYMTRWTPMDAEFKFPEATVKWKTTSSAELKEGVLLKDIPWAYQKVDVELSRSAVRDAIKAGLDVSDFAEIVTQDVLSIK